MNPSDRDGLPAISTITISRDDPAGLEATLASIARQSLAPFEAVLVRAGTSRAVPLAPPIAARAREIADPGSGISGAFNAAIAASRGEWLVFLNGGDRLREPGSLETLAAACRQASGADIVACRARTDRGEYIPWFRPGTLSDYLFISHQASAFRRALFDQIGHYSTQFRIRMDLDWMERYLAARGSDRIAVRDEVIVDYASGGISARSVARFHLEELRVLRRDPRFRRALLGLLLRRFPEGVVRSALGLR